MTTSSYKRASRVAGEVYMIIAEVCRKELSDPRLERVQLTGADMTDDLQIVKVFYYVDGDEKEKARVLKGLESAKGYLRRAISERLKLRKTPEIRYYFDEAIEQGEKIDKLFDNI